MGACGLDRWLLKIEWNSGRKSSFGELCEVTERAKLRKIRDLQACARSLVGGLASREERSCLHGGEMEATCRSGGGRSMGLHRGD